MALFVSAAERRRRLVLSCIASAVVALIVGVMLGRAGVPTLQDRARSLAASGALLATRVDALTIEYEQAVSGGGDSVAMGVDEPLAGIETELTLRMRRAPWITSSVAEEVLTATGAVRAAADKRVSPTEFAALTSTASELIRRALGVT